jgi:hypothetical protein
MNMRDKQSGPHCGIRTHLICGLAAAAFALAGCAGVPAYEQALVSKPGMLFSDSFVGNPRVDLQTQIEAGTAVSGGAQAAGCTACR